MHASLLVAIITCSTTLSSAAAENPVLTWPQFRGPNGSGVAPRASPPTEIGPGNGVLWKSEVPWSPSSPCVWANHLFLSTYEGHQLQTRCYDSDTGQLLWTAGVKPDEVETFHRSDGSPAASTPCTDGVRVVSYFGSFGLVCYDVTGQELWRLPLPVAVSGGGFGSGTSPVIAGNLILLNRDQDQNSSLLAVDLQTGTTVWETPRPEALGSFGTPILWDNEGTAEVVLAGSLRIKGYDLKTGVERWVVEGITGFVCTTPVIGDGWLFFAGWSPGKADAPWGTWESFLGSRDKNGDGEVALEEFDEGSRDFSRGLDRDHNGKITRSDWDVLLAAAARAENVLVAVKSGGRGDISSTHVAWKHGRGLPYVPSPLFYEGRLYLIRDGGLMSSLDAKSGKPHYVQERINATGSYYASPVVGDGRIYVASLPGKLSVIKAGGDTPEVLHQADFGERIFATPVLFGERIYLRTEKHLWAFGK